MATREEVEEYLRGLYERSLGDAPISPVAAFGADVSPTPEALAKRPRFDSMLDGPAFNDVRAKMEDGLEADRQGMEDMGSVPARPLPGYGAPSELAAGPRRPLPSAPGVPSVDEGSAGPANYLAALRRAQGMDDLSAAVGRGNAAMQQLASITSRGVFQPQPLAPMPSEVSKEEKRRQLVADYLKQQREGAQSDADLRLKQAHADFYGRTKLPPPVDPLLDDKRLKIQNEAEAAKALAEARRRPPVPRVVKAPPPPKPEKEPKPVEGVAVGYDIDKARPPSKDQIKDFGNIVASRYELAGLTNKMRRLAKEFNALERAKPGSGKTQVQQTARQIQIRAKDIAGLGALSGPDMALMESLASNPADITTAFVDLQAQMDGLDDWASNAESARARAWGFRPAEKMPTAKTVVTKSEEERLKELEAKEKAGTLGGK